MAKFISGIRCSNTLKNTSHTHTLLITFYFGYPKTLFSKDTITHHTQHTKTLSLILKHELNLKTFKMKFYLIIKRFSVELYFDEQ